MINNEGSQDRLITSKRNIHHPRMAASEVNQSVFGGTRRWNDLKGLLGRASVHPPREIQLSRIRTINQHILI